MYLEEILFATLAIINIAAFFVMANDKRRSTRGSSNDRIPEGLIFFMATAFGSVGIYAAMFLLRHKTRKWYFQVGVPLLIVQNVATIYVISKLLVLN